MFEHFLMLHKRIIYWLTLFFAILVSFIAKSQQTRFRVIHFDETTGLQTTIINSILQDKTGYMWFGTGEGLYRYDGYTFQAFKKIVGESNSLQDNAVQKLAEDHDGKIWIGLLNGISSYDPATGIFANYSVKDIDSTSPVHDVSMLFIDKENNVWAGLMQKGLIKLDKASGTFSHYDVIPASNTFYSTELRSSYNIVYDMYEEGSGTYWLATHDGLYRFNERTKTMQPVRARPIIKDMVRNDLFLSIANDRNGLWLGSWAGGLSYYNFRTNAWSNYKFNPQLTNTGTINIAHNIKFDKNGTLWVATSDKGIGTFDTATKQFDFYSDDISTRSMMPANHCNLFYRDRQNNLWLSYADGLYKVQYYENRFRFMPVTVTKTTNADFYGVSCMLEDTDNNMLFTGTSFADGLHILDRNTGKFTTLSFQLMPKEESIMLVNDIMKDHNGMVWILTRDYVYQYNPIQNKLVSIPQPSPYSADLPSNHYSAIREDKKGRIWIASYRNGVFCYDPLSKTYKHYYDDPANKNSLSSNVTGCLAVDKKNNVWVGGSRGCFGYFDSTGSFININTQNTKFEDRVFALFADVNKNIWVGTDDKLYAYNTQGIRPRLEKTFDGENGLKGNAITAIQQDADNNIWCITNSALCKINKDFTVITYGRSDGIDKIGSLGGFYLFANKNMAVFTYQGYYAFDPASMQKKNERIPLVITSFKIDDKEQYYEAILKTHNQVTVPARSNVISFEFAALDFTQPDKQQYLYKLDGFDKDWVNAGQRRYAGYANLPGGDYVFKVKAAVSGIDNNDVASIPVRIVQPAYKTWWFITLMTVLLVAGIYFFYQFKLNRQQQICSLETKTEQLEKEKAMAMYEGLKQQLNPHFLFNSLTSLSSLIQYDQKAAGNFLEGLSKIYRYILKSRNHETVPLIEEIKFVQTFVQLQQTRFEKGLSLNIDVSEELSYCKIVPVTLQNLIENAIKHNIIDVDSPLHICIYAENEYLVVKNNLQKKNFVETSNKQGLTNLMSLYSYLTPKQLIIKETNDAFFIKLPLL